MKSDDTEFVSIDDTTLSDLEVFTASTSSQSLFEYCNLTRTDGGARALRQRMSRPSSNSAQIESTQVAVSFVIQNRQSFKFMPTAYATNIVLEHYLKAILPIIEGENKVDFSLGVFGFWTNRDSHYVNIVRGVRTSCELINTLRAFTSLPELADTVGELKLLVDEMRTLLLSTRLAEIPTKKMGRRMWRILAVDQLLRLTESTAFLRLMDIASEIDALVSMADVTQSRGLVLPSIGAGPLSVEAEGLFHPFISAAVGNSLTLSQKCRTIFLTGPNMAGKTTYIRATATAMLMAQMGMGVAATKFRFSPAQHLFTSISVSDNLQNGISYFRAEAIRVKELAQAVSSKARVLALMDEPFKGTNVIDAHEASSVIIEKFSTKQDCLFVFASHLIELKKQFIANKNIVCLCFTAQELDDELCFDYLIRAGVSDQRLGMRVLREEGIFELLE